MYKCCPKMWIAPQCPLLTEIETFELWYGGGKTSDFFSYNFYSKVLVHDMNYDTILLKHTLYHFPSNYSNNKMGTKMSALHFLGHFYQDLNVDGNIYILLDTNILWMYLILLVRYVTDLIKQ